jgi:hypothetical protein
MAHNDSPTISDPSSIPPGKKLIFRPWRVDPITGKRLYAAHYGKKAWPMIVDE